jgi:endonuclease-8
VYASHDGWQKPQSRAWLILEVDGAVCVCFSPKTLELLSPDGLRRHPFLRRLGPDLLGAPIEPEVILKRFRVHSAVSIGEAVMNQSIVCGIGNVYKSEILFLCRIHPLVTVGQLSDELLLQLVNEARRLMQKNSIGYPRRTRFRGDGQRLWVYRRSGQKCYVCGRVVQMRRQGDMGRSTYWCPGCQRAEGQRRESVGQ